jgi:hypothetical protein
MQVLLQSRCSSYAAFHDRHRRKTLTALAKGGSKAEVIRKAVATYSYLKQEVPSMDPDKRLSITDAAGNVQKDVILP